MTDHPITEAIQDQAWALLNRLNEDWIPTLGYWNVDDDLFVEVMEFLSEQGIVVEPPPLSSVSLIDHDDLSLAEYADMMQAAANRLVDLIRAIPEGAK